MTSTVDRAGFQVGINFGSDATLQINGESLATWIDRKEDKDAVLTDVYRTHSIILTASDSNPAGYITGTTWTKLSTFQAGSVTLYVWERTA